MQTRMTRRARTEPAGRWTAGSTHRGTRVRAETKGEVTMQPEARSGQMDGVSPHPLAELLNCPPATGNLLDGAAQCIDYDAGAIVFRQDGICHGLYVVVSVQFLRKAERLETRLTLGTARAGDLAELAAALGDGRHTYTLSAQTPGSVLLLPIDALNLAFQNYPPLRMQLLEELAREVSRGYRASCQNRAGTARRRDDGATLQ